MASKDGSMGSMGEVFAGRYELVDPLASGGGGVIWRVWDQRQKEYRAGKVLKQSHSDSLLRFMRETSWRVEHRNVITPLGWVGEDDKVMFTMPLIRGGSLAQIIKEEGALPPAWAVSITRQLLDALTAVHDQGLVHRDIKPANILLEPTATSIGGEPFIYLSDFGIAAPIGDPRMTRASEVIGTPGYMSPEAQYGADPMPQQDIYAVGVVLLEMLTGRRPPSEGVPTIPPAAAALPMGQYIAQLLDEETRRPQTAREAREKLLATPLPPSAPRPIVIPDRIPDWPEGWTDAGPDLYANRTTVRSDVIPLGATASTLPAGQQFPMQPTAGQNQHRPAPGWGENSPSTGRSASQALHAQSPGTMYPPTQGPGGTLVLPPPPPGMPRGGHFGQPSRPQQFVGGIAAQPNGGVLTRIGAWPAWSGWGLVLVGLACIAIALLLMGG